MRLPESMENRLPGLTIEEWFEIDQVSVTDVRQIIDWAARRSEIASDKIAVFGISFGGLISSIVMGIDSRIKAGIVVVSAGNTEKMGASEPE